MIQSLMKVSKSMSGAEARVNDWSVVVTKQLFLQTEMKALWRPSIRTSALSAPYHRAGVVDVIWSRSRVLLSTDNDHTAHALTRWWTQWSAHPIDTLQQSLSSVSHPSLACDHGAGAQWNRSDKQETVLNIIWMLTLSHMWAVTGDETPRLDMIQDTVSEWCREHLWCSSAVMVWKYNF